MTRKRQPLDEKAPLKDGNGEPMARTGTYAKKVAESHIPHEKPARLYTMARTGKQQVMMEVESDGSVYQEARSSFHTPDQDKISTNVPIADGQMQQDQHHAEATLHKMEAHTDSVRSPQEDQEALADTGSKADAKVEAGLNWMTLTGKTTYQSSSRPGIASSRAVDGDTRMNWGSSSCIHTNSEANPWWEVDLGAKTATAKLNIYPRSDCCQHYFNPFYVSLDGTECVSSQSANRASLTVDCGLIGQKLKIGMKRTDYMTLCEVQVAEAPAPVVTTLTRVTTAITTVYFAP